MSAPPPTSVVSARSGAHPFGRLCHSVLRDALHAGALSWTLALQDIRARYRKTFLGVLWTMLPPIAIAAGFALANRAQVFRVADTPLPYLIYVLIGTALWQIFAEALEGPYNALEQARSYITRISFPREVFLLSHFIGNVVPTLVKLGILVAIVLLAGVPLPPSAVLLPVALLGALLLGYAIGLLLTPLLVLFADLLYVVRILMAYGMFLAPVVYPPPASGIFRWIVNLNPVTPLIMTARECLLGWHLSYPLGFALVTAAGVLLLLAGTVLMRLALPFLLERMLVGGR